MTERPVRFKTIAVMEEIRERIEQIQYPKDVITIRPKIKSKTSTRQ